MEVFSTARLFLVLLTITTFGEVKCQYGRQQLQHNYNQNQQRTFSHLTVHPPNDIDTKIQVTEEEEPGIFDTFSLSFVGNFSLSKALDGISKILEGIATCK